MADPTAHTPSGMDAAELVTAPLPLDVRVRAAADRTPAAPVSGALAYLCGVLRHRATERMPAPPAHALLDALGVVCDLALAHGC